MQGGKKPKTRKKKRKLKAESERNPTTWKQAPVEHSRDECAVEDELQLMKNGKEINRD